MKNRGYILIITLLAIIAIVIVPTIPHHHHQGLVHIGYDLADLNDCNEHNRDSESGDDTCCDDDCKARLHFNKPSHDYDYSPELVVIALLFDDYLIKFLLNPHESELACKHHFLESLHGTHITSAFSLRGPPCCFMA